MLKRTLAVLSAAAILATPAEAISVPDLIAPGEQRMRHPPSYVGEYKMLASGMLLAFSGVTLWMIYDEKH